MKYVLVDRYAEIVRGERAVAFKNIPLGEDYYPASALEPSYAPSLLMESMAQTAGMLIGSTFDFERKTVFAKIETAEFPRLVRPGDHVELRARFLEEMGGHCRMETEALVDGERVGFMIGLFTALRLDKEEGAVFNTQEFARARESTLKSLGVLDILAKRPLAEVRQTEGGL
ncbi:MAG: hypothetical protein HY303_06045 [Candidatus Wallbacteria bacterium]|nr:hypothetical protein [Candidatus Wallbacteria bacterium]